MSGGGSIPGRAGGSRAPGAPRTIMIMAGGTGGHIFPALAVAAHLRRSGWKIVWLGARRGMEAGLVTPHGYDMAWIRFSGVRGKGLLRLALLPFDLLAAFWQSARAIFAHRPDIVLGMGGYVSFPGGMMAALLNRPLAIHEQNSVAGLANRMLALVADRVLVAFPDPFAKAPPGGSRNGGSGVARRYVWRIPRPSSVLLVGNPVRAEIAALAAPQSRYADRSGCLRLLVLGGSRGATVLNEVVPQAIARLPRDRRPVVAHQSGVDHIEALRQNYRAAGVDAELLPFIADMAAQYAAADLVVCRAGATTVFELAAAGVAAVLVPYPHAADDHQTHNARFLADRGAAVLIPQRDFTPERLAVLLGQYNRDRLVTMARAARGAAMPDAVLRVADACMELAA